MASVVVSESGGTRIAVENNRWLVMSSGRAMNAEDALVALLPLLEHEPEDALTRVRSLGGPQFPWQSVVAAALSGKSPYWQERAVPWLDALHAEPEGELADAARRAIQHGRASQRHRQQLHRWLDGKPIRGL